MTCFRGDDRRSVPIPGQESCKMRGRHEGHIGQHDKNGIGPAPMGLADPEPDRLGHAEFGMIVFHPDETGIIIPDAARRRDARLTPPDRR